MAPNFAATMERIDSALSGVQMATVRDQMTFTLILKALKASLASRLGADVAGRRGQGHGHRPEIADSPCLVESLRRQGRRGGRRDSQRGHGPRHRPRALRAVVGDLSGGVRRFRSVLHCGRRAHAVRRNHTRGRARDLRLDGFGRSARQVYRAVAVGIEGSIPQAFLPRATGKRGRSSDHNAGQAGHLRTGRGQMG